MIIYNVCPCCVDEFNDFEQPNVIVVTTDSPRPSKNIVVEFYTMGDDDAPSMPES